MHIAEYFYGSDVGKTLESYAAFIAGSKPKWSLNYKLQLYQIASSAFDTSVSESARRVNFATIYEELHGTWSVFRNGRPGLRPDELFDILTYDCASCSRQRGLALGRIDTLDNREAIRGAIDNIKDVKLLHSGRSSTMAISKFLHFFNPRLFPVYDREVIENKVLGVFRSEWRELNGRLCGTEYPHYLRYMLWANSFFTNDYRRIMNDFTHWFAQQVNTTAEQLPDDFQTYYAVAFEYIAIGAALLENLQQRDNSGNTVHPGGITCN